MESSKSSKIKRLLTIKDQYLVDRDKYIFDYVLSFNLFELHQLAIQHFRGLIDFYHAWESNLMNSSVSETYNFPEFVSLCFSNYILSQRVVVSKNRSVLFMINSQYIYEMLKMPQNPEREMLNERVLAEHFKGLSSQAKTSLLESYLCQNINVPEDIVNFKIDMFPKTSRQIIAMITVNLGNDDDKIVNEYILGFMTSIFPPTVKPLVKFNYAKYLDDNIHF